MNYFSFLFSFWMVTNQLSHVDKNYQVAIPTQSDQKVMRNYGRNWDLQISSPHNAFSWNWLWGPYDPLDEGSNPTIWQTKPGQSLCSGSFVGRISWIHRSIDPKGGQVRHSQFDWASFWVTELLKFASRGLNIAVLHLSILWVLKSTCQPLSFTSLSSKSVQKLVIKPIVCIVITTEPFMDYLVEF